MPDPQPEITVLVVDDEPSIVESLDILFTLRGFRVRTATSAAAARALVDDALDVVVADHRMPGETGVALLTWMRAAHPAVRRILLTGYADQDAMLGAINDAQVFHFLRKPWSNAELVNLVERASEARRSELQLRSALARDADLLRTAPLAILRADDRGQVLARNAAADALGAGGAADLAELLGKNHWQALLEDLQLHGAAGREHLDVGGVPMRAQASMRHDVVAGWTIQLCLEDRRSLEAAEDLRKKAEGMLSLRELTGSVLHDFRNQLTVVVSMAETLRECLEDEGDAELAGDITTAAREAGELANQLLDLTRIADELPVPVALGPTVRRSCRMLRRLLPKSIVLEEEVEDAAPPVRARSADVQRVLANLVVNARDALREGGRIRVGVRAVEGGVELAVIDDGDGMPEEVRARALDPYFTTKAPGRGTGLGLAMVGRFARDAGGVVHIASATGQGTAVLVVLPAVAPPALPPGLRAGIAAPPGTEAALRRALEELGVVVEASGWTREIDVLFVDLGWTEGALPPARARIALGGPRADADATLTLPFTRTGLQAAIGAAVAGP